MVRVNRKTCPRCGADEDCLAASPSSPEHEGQVTRWIITENCPDCKAYLKLNLVKKEAVLID